jgi:hypothetical protein
MPPRGKRSIVQPVHFETTDALKFAIDYAAVL